MAEARQIWVIKLLDSRNEKTSSAIRRGCCWRGEHLLIFPTTGKRRQQQEGISTKRDL